MQWSSIVRFSDHPNPFLVEESFCRNPDCDCKLVGFLLREVGDSGEEISAPLRISFHVDLETWQEHGPAARTAQAAGWIAEFLADFPAGRREEVRERYEQEKRICRRMAGYTIDVEELLQGRLVSYADLLSENGAISHGGTSFTDRMVHRDVEYLIEDLYCPNPECDCREVHVQFWKVGRPAEEGTRTALRPAFLGKLTFSGRREVVQRENCSAAVAKSVFAEWWNHAAGDLPMFENRYRHVKEIGQRNLDAADVVPEGEASRDAGPGDVPLFPVELEAATDKTLLETKRVGRNDPCPCGSGRKYKKCCAGAAGVDSENWPRTPR